MMTEQKATEKVRVFVQACEFTRLKLQPWKIHKIWVKNKSIHQILQAEENNLAEMT